MTMDVNVKRLKRNAFRQSKVRGETASRVRVPGGLVSARSMARIVGIAEEFGNGEIFLTNRQGVEIPGIRLEDMPQVNARLKAIIEDTRINQEDTDHGYLASGTRNVVACPGKRLCPFGCYDTTAFARRMDQAIFPNNRHVKVAFTGCSNDCAHVALNDFGIIGMTEPQYDPTRCIGCGRCNYACPTCSCYTMQDVYYTDNGKVGERRRVGSSCMVDGYTNVAGGGQYRKTQGERMRFKTLHKIRDFRKRFGYDMCVGCGRCDDICGEYISFSNIINKVAAAVEEMEKEGSKNA